jgi:release factor glutamine methyltransferase
MLVEIALAEVRARGNRHIADVGTGTGAIAIAVALNARAVQVDAIDSSEAALAIARRNVEAHGIGERVKLRGGDLLAGAGRYGVVVANLPYVPDARWAELAPELRDYEPREALTVGPRGTEVIERLLAQAPAHLADGGLLALEIDETQARHLLCVATAAFGGDARVQVHRDLAGRDRVLTVRARGEDA